MRRCWSTRLAALLIEATLILSTTAHAQESIEPEPKHLLQWQLETFADLVGEDTDAVSRRILWDPGLTPLVAAAADARTHRRRLGKGLTIGGFSLMGLGLIVGGIMVISGIAAPWDTNCPYEGGSNCESNKNDDAEIHAGLTVMVVSLAAGLAVGLPGLIVLSSTAEAEDSALNRYRRLKEAPRPSMSATDFRAVQGSQPGKSFNLSLVSFRF
jgi:hypothetical protein